MSFFETHKARILPNFSRNELGLGTILGTGGFCVVHEIIAIRLLSTSRTCSGGDIQENSSQNPSVPGVVAECMDVDDTEVDDDSLSSAYDDSNDDDDNMYDEGSARTFMVQSCMRKRGGGSSARYAIKRLKATLTGNTIKKGIDDIAVEAKFLAVVQVRRVSV